MGGLADQLPLFLNTQEDVPKPPKNQQERGHLESVGK